MADSVDPVGELSQRLATSRERIRAYLLGIVRDPGAADDLTQETLLRAHRQLRHLEDPQKFLPWLYRIATNVARDRFRAASHRHRLESLDSDATGQSGAADTLADSSPRLDKAMERKEMSSCVQEFLSALSDPYRAVILLHDTQGMTNPEIAAMLGVSLATVKIRLHRARAKLRAVLADGCRFSTDERGVLVCDPKEPPTKG